MKQVSAVVLLLIGVKANKYVPEKASIHDDQGTYYTVPGGWSGQQIPGRGFERPDTGLDDETVLKKKNTQVKSLEQLNYVPEKASIHDDQGTYYTVPGGWSGQQIPGRGFERPDTGLDDETVLSKKRSFISQGEEYVPEKASIHDDQGTYYTVPGGWSGQQIPGRGFERPDTGLDDETVLSKKKAQSVSQYVPEKASIHDDQGTYYTVPGGWSGQQIPGRGFERPDTGLDDETVLSKKKAQSVSQYVPEKASIHDDQGPYYTVPAGWSGQQIPGRGFERPDTGLDDETVLSKKKAQSASQYVPEKASIHDDQGTYYTVPGGWSGQQIPGRGFERPDTGLDDETVLSKKKAQSASQYVPEKASIHGDQPLYYTVPGGWSSQQIPGRAFERPDTGLDDDAILKKKHHHHKSKQI